MPGNPLADRYYDELKAIFDKATALLHGKGKSGKQYTQEQVNQYIATQNPAIPTFKGLARELQRIEPLRQIPEADQGVLDKGAVARTVLYGHGAMPFSDELAGLVSGIASKAAGADYLPGYQRGRDVNRAYLSRAEQDQGPGRTGALNLLGAASGGLPLGLVEGGLPLWGLGAPGEAAAVPGILRSAATGAGVAGAYGVGGLPDYSASTLKENAVPLMEQMGAGAVLGAAPAAIGTSVVNRIKPEAAVLEGALHAAGGTEGVLANAAQAGTPRPMLAELGGTLGRARKLIQRASAEAQAKALDAVNVELAATGAEKARIGAKYSVLEQPINDPRVAEIIKRPNVQKLMQEMIDEGVAPANEITGRSLEDLRQELMQHAARKFRAGHNRIGARARDAANDLKTILDENSPQFAAIRGEYGPVARRELRLKKMAMTLSREGRGIGVPVETSPSLHKSMMREVGQEGWQRQMKAANRLVPLLYTAGVPEDLLHAAHGIMPSLMRPAPAMARGASIPGAIGGMIPQLTDPFFPLRQVQGGQQ